MVHFISPILLMNIVSLMANAFFVQIVGMNNVIFCSFSTALSFVPKFCKADVKMSSSLGVKTKRAFNDGK